jgi:hypothetical protein
MLASHLHDKVADGCGPQRHCSESGLAAWRPSFVWLVTGREAHKDPLAAACIHLLCPLLCCRAIHLIHTLHSTSIERRRANIRPSSYHTALAPASTCLDYLRFWLSSSHPLCTQPAPVKPHSRPVTVAQSQAFPYIPPALHHTNNRWSWHPIPNDLRPWPTSTPYSLRPRTRHSF